MSIDLREVRFGRESTRWKYSFSFTDDGPLGSSESSHSSESSSSSSMALSETSSSSSSDSSNTGLCSAALPTATSSLKEVCFLLLPVPQILLFGRLRLSESELLYIWLSSELSSSPDDVPIVNMAPFFLGTGCAEGGDFLRMSVGCAARFVCDR